ncbi:hypothetical protein Pst134EA_029242 [Puccinia striiformis f. sp. tritici]|uniref:hypothetical protein n=1 Tax=Puccinia striiformis f. sp. tritici TaxID=168172 RepID=UPI0020081EB1|nr:hypothetical protein Pst134EA_029242 [Puccinia striiformis f. sp. tritici]KAH9447205.1 hypothetical protein Pst134EA_029242 [Puccinia striiformis f. sp. tritici]
MRAMNHPSHQLGSDGVTQKLNTRVRDVTLRLLRPPAFRSARAELASTAERKTGRKVNPAPPQAQRALDANGQPSRLSYQFFGACIQAEQPPHEDNKTYMRWVMMNFLQSRPIDVVGLAD